MFHSDVGMLGKTLFSPRELANLLGCSITAFKAYGFLFKGLGARELSSFPYAAAG